MAEKIGELSDRFAKIEGEFAAQTAPLDGAKAAQEAALTALSAALKGIEQLNFHVLQNNLGAVSTRIEKVDANWQAKARELGVTIKRVDDALVEVASQLRSELAAGNKSRVELGRNVATETGAVKTMLGEIGGRLAALQSDFAQRIDAARKEFATPTTLNPRGDWSPRETYDRLDVVTLNGTSYIAQRQTKEKPRADSADWQVLARRGALSAQAGGGVSDITGVAGMGATGLQIAQSGTPDEARGILGINDFIGATAGTDGEAGRVPQPDAGEQGLFLRGDGTWAAAAVVTATLATTSEALAGTDNVKYISPLTGNARALLGDSTRAVADTLYFDGVTSGARAFAALGTPGNLATSPLTLHTWVYNDGVDPLTTRGIRALSSSATTGQNAGAFALTLFSGGFIRAALYGSSAGNSRHRQFNFTSVYAVGWHLISVTFDRLSAPLVYIDGIAVTTTESTFGATPPAWTDALISTYQLIGVRAGDERWSGGLIPVAPINRVQSAAEILAYAQTGRMPASDELGTGSVVQQLLNNDFSAFTGTPDDSIADTITSWTKGANLVTEAITGGLRLTRGASFASNGSGNNLFAQTSATNTLLAKMTPGTRWGYKVRARYYGSAASAYIWVNQVTIIAHGLTASFADYEGQFTVVPAISGSPLSLAPSSGTVGDGIEIESVELYPLGLIAKWQDGIQPIAVVADSGANKIPLVLTSGVTPITQKRDWVIQGSTNTNGNQQLLGASVFVAPNVSTKQMLDTIEVSAASGTPTVGVGSASGGAQYVTAAAIATGSNRRTLVTPVVGTANVWISSNSTDVLQHTIRGHIIDV